MRDTPSFSVTLCSIISSLLCLTGVTSADKSQTNITIAFLGPYLAFPGVKLNGSLVTAYPTFASNIVRYNGVASSLGLAIWCDIGAQIAVDMINKSPNILPNATIIVKRFNDLDPVFSRGGSGYGMQVAMKIQEEHPDVVAVYGGNGITQTLLSSSLYSIFKIPHCTSMVSSERFDNENKRPYYFSLLANTGSGSAICLLLNRWNVKRVGFITESGSADLVTSFNRCNVRIVSLSKVENDISVSEIVRIGNLLEYYDIRFVWRHMSTIIAHDV
ncbi:hypothetical protein BCR33DRAFT_787090 [Rhizoclosmatium globosum]|uniref:Receptor ligand binding region domain-containing protein n=1 Tax=Rhizoclosmatium globosum TaxID=329046 RepID=A0A1Y2C342_9FUNG|nr:hypothetical protein BCR33DRAFT_787090 [Rhizoclosmatium globosum]|eukprot:ORY41366.1 hypothetical protein BCR33DRAFT_787090 [Rhizoclosmatium globosum]